MKIMHIVGARPNFMKVAPIMAEMAKRPDMFSQVLVHTGQHYDVNMSDVFFRDLGMPAPDEFLGVGSGSHAVQTAKVMTAFEPVLLKHSPDWVLVVGDVNSTLACALVAAKLGVKVVHVEAGLRSGDWSMPEEINRVLTDRLSDMLLIPSEDAQDNLLKEGVSPQKIRLVGNIMIDSLVRFLPVARRRKIFHDLGLRYRAFLLATFHRPSNVDDPSVLKELLEALNRINEKLPVVFPMHPRTHKAIAGFSLEHLAKQLRITEPLGYIDFLCLTDAARVVLTDSGGIQEETSYLGIPCITVRPNTERPITVKLGTNRLVSSVADVIVAAFEEALAKPHRPNCDIPKWDGRTAARIASMLESSYHRGD